MVAAAPLALAAACLLLLGLSIRLGGRIRNLERRLDKAFKGSEDQGLEGALEILVDQAQELRDGMRYLKEAQDEARQKVRSAVQLLGLVRYDAFRDTGGEQSFALALLDEEGNGAVINSLFSRNECHVYAKPIAHWQSIHPLSEEEGEALKRARRT